MSIYNKIFENINLSIATIKKYKYLCKKFNVIYENVKKVSIVGNELKQFQINYEEFDKIIIEYEKLNNKKMSLEQKKQFVNIVRKIKELKKFKYFDEFDKVLKVMRTQRDIQIREQGRTKEQIEKWVSLDKINKVINEQEKTIKKIMKKKLKQRSNDNLNLIQYNLLMNLYINTATLRNTYNNIKVIRTKKEIDKIIANKEEYNKHNYLYISRSICRFYILNHKQMNYIAFKKKILQFNVNKKVRKLILRWLKITNNDFLIINVVSGNIYNQSSNFSTYFTELNKKYLNKPIGSRQLRVIVVNDRNKGGNIQERLENSKKLNHTIRTELIYYDKKDIDVNNNNKIINQEEKVEINIG